MASSQTLRVRRTDRQGEHLLVNVRSKGQGKIRNLKFVALDRGDTKLYHGNVKDANAKSLQSGSYTGDLDEWKKIVYYVFCLERPDGPLPAYLRDLEIVVSAPDTTASLIIRKKISGISQKLGSIDLQQDNDREEVDVLEWADDAIISRDTLRNELEALQASMDSQRQEVARLSHQLDELVRAKKEHEDELLSKFAALLNAKKLKIRDQQRLLSGDKTTTVGTRSGTSHQATAKSRPAKRKADEAAVNKLDPQDQEDEDEDDHDMLGTPEQTDVETDGEDDDREQLDDDEVVRDSHHAGLMKGSAAVSQVPDHDIDLSRRELPFSRGKSKVTEESMVENGDDNDETDDDEL